MVGGVCLKIMKIYVNVLSKNVMDLKKSSILAYAYKLSASVGQRNAIEKRRKHKLQRTKIFWKEKRNKNKIENTMNKKQKCFISYNGNDCDLDTIKAMIEYLKAFSNNSIDFLFYEDP